jgi:hypothetical protein
MPAAPKVRVDPGPRSRIPSAARQMTWRRPVNEFSAGSFLGDAVLGLDHAHMHFEVVGENTEAQGFARRPSRRATRGRSRSSGATQPGGPGLTKLGSRAS